MNGLGWIFMVEPLHIMAVNCSGPIGIHYDALLAMVVSGAFATVSTLRG